METEYMITSVQKEIGDVEFLSSEWYETYFNIFVIK